MDQKATIDAVLAGDDARFTDIVQHFDAPLRRIVGRSMRDSHALEEVIQETWLRAYRQLSRLSDTHKLESWLEPTPIGLPPCVGSRHPLDLSPHP